VSRGRVRNWPLSPTGAALLSLGKLDALSSLPWASKGVAESWVGRVRSWSEGVGKPSTVVISATQEEEAGGWKI
jgi:hypothetical protein